MPPLPGKIAIVTGAGRYNGIGRHSALALARQGADVERHAGVEAEGPAGGARLRLRVISDYI